MSQKTIVTYFKPIFRFYTGGTEMEYWLKMEIKLEKLISLETNFTNIIIQGSFMFRSSISSVAATTLDKTASPQIVNVFLTFL